jgi:hypothetical protein
MQEPFSLIIPHRKSVVLCLLAFATNLRFVFCFIDLPFTLLIILENLALVNGLTFVLILVADRTVDPKSGYKTHVECFKSSKFVAIVQLLYKN